MIKFRVFDDNDEFLGYEWLEDGRWKHSTVKCPGEVFDGVFGLPVSRTRLQYTNHKANCGECGGKGQITCEGLYEDGDNVDCEQCDRQHDRINKRDSQGNISPADKPCEFKCPACTGTGKVEVYEGDDVEVNDSLLIGKLRGVVVMKEGTWRIRLDDEPGITDHYALLAAYINKLTVIKGE